MFVFAHLHKCAGTSIIVAAEKAGMKLPSGHVNGCPPNADGDALCGIGRMAPPDIERLLRSYERDGVEFMALEWDFPRMEKFPAAMDLAFFTLFRDPTERLVSNYIYDVVQNYTDCRSIGDYIGSDGIWTQDNFYVRFFAGLQTKDAVDASHLDYAIEIVSSRFKYAFIGDDLMDFLTRQVGLPINSVPRANRTGRFARLFKQSRLKISPADREAIREMNALDHRLCEALKSIRAAENHS